MTNNVAIIGGGISGLATAFYVKKLKPECNVTLLEKAPRLGGTMHTINKEGFLFETGSNGFLSNKPDTLDLVKESGAEELLMRSSDAARIRYIYNNGLHRLPENPPAFFGSKLLSLRGKLRVMGEVLVPPRKDDSDESLGEFGYRRLGKEFTDIFLNAMSAGVYASSPEKISVKAAFPMVVALEKEYGGLFKGMIKKRKKKAGPGGVLMSFKGGVGTYIEHMHKTLDAEIRTGVEVTGLEKTDNGYRIAAGGESIEAEQIVLSTPSFVTAKILEGVDREIGSQLDAIDYSPISVVGLGYHNLAHPLDGFGLLTTASANLDILGVLWDSSVFTDRAPEGKKSLRIMIGGQRSPELALQDEDGLLKTAIEGVRKTMGIDQEPGVTFVQRWERGIPNYRVGHLGQIDAIFEKLAAYPGLHLNSNAYYGISLNDCVSNSLACARKIADG